MKRISLFILALIVSAGLINGQGPKKTTVGLQVGNVAPDINLQSPDGKVINLSSLRGQVVLIDFWASWCGPCRMENPHLVKAYTKYKDTKFKNGNGFTIYSVSLDKGKEQWVNAIKQDKLEWAHHVSDLKFWYSEAARLYGVQSIPANWLIDKDGVILATNLRGATLEQALASLSAAN